MVAKVRPSLRIVICLFTDGSTCLLGQNPQTILHIICHVESSMLQKLLELQRALGAALFQL